MPEGGFRFEPLQSGDPLQIGPYELRARLGAGGMGSVFLAFTPGGQAIAVKVVKPELARDPQFAQRFTREVRTAQRVSGRHVAQLLDADPEAREPWLASIYVAGPSLHELVIATGPLSVRDILAITIGIARALESIHGAGVVHRDLKPANVMLDETGPKVIDFGIVKSLETTTATDSSSTRVGTLPYMSPEQALGQGVSPSSDIFALGASVYFLATQRLAFEADNGVAIAYRIVNDEPDLTVLDPQLRNLVSACLNKDPRARPSAGGVIEIAQTEFGPLAPGAYLGIAQATAAIRQRTSALHKLVGEFPTDFEEATAPTIAVPPRGQPRAQRATITARPSARRGAAAPAATPNRSGARSLRISRRQATGAVAALALIALLAVLLPIWLSHSSSKSPGALAAHSSAPSTKPPATFTGSLLNPCDVPSSATLAQFHVQLSAIFHTGPVPYYTDGADEDCMWTTPQGGTFAYSALLLRYLPNDRILPTGSTVKVLGTTAVETNVGNYCQLAWSTSYGQAQVVVDTSNGTFAQACSFGIQFADAIYSNVPQ